MRLIIALFFSLLYSFTGSAQNGSYYLAQYDLKDRGLSNYNYDIVQDSRGLIYMANLKGVVVSDGLDWSLIETPFSVFALAFDNNNNLYVGGRKEIAVIDKARNSSESYHVISKVKQEIIKITYHKGDVYFLTEKTLYSYSTSSKKLSTIDNLPGDTFLDIITINESVYIVSSGLGIQELSESKSENFIGGLPSNSLGVKISTQGTQFVYTSTGEYFLKKLNDTEYKEFLIEDEGYLEQNTPVKIRWVNADLIAISTISGGVVFISSTTGKVEQYMNYENGLSDNEVLTLFVSKNNIVWCSTPQGVSIIAPETPIRNYASYKGLSGKIQVVREFDDRLFVGTSVGLFELVKKSVFKDIVSYKKVTKKEKIRGEVLPEEKKGLFKKKSKSKATPITITRNKTYYQKQVTKQLLSQNYEYKKIDSIDSKVVQLIEYKGRLLIGSLSGIFELKNNQTIKIFEQPIVYIYKPEQSSFLMVSTYDKEIKVLTESQNNWIETGLLNGLDDLVEQIEQGDNGSLWLCGADSIYRVVLNSAYTLDDVEVYPINNPHWERIYANPYKGKTYFLNTSGYYYYEDHSIKKDSLMEKNIGLPTKMILSSNNNLWVNTGHFWYGQGKDLNNSLNFISLFEDPRYIAEAGDNNFWVVAGNNQLYKINGDELSSISRKFELFLETAQIDSVAMQITEVMGDIDQQSSLSFKFASPDYTNIYQTEFQYRLVGLSSEWSEWSRTNNEITFPYLPSGRYRLEVKARDALGNEQNSESISFRILAPYWKRSWFYLIELIFFGGLMTISVIINRRTHRFTLLSRLLTYLTLIFIVEFVQTIAEAKFETNQSPVINFFIQVAIALSILPAELVLRKFITKKQREEAENKTEALQKNNKENQL